MFTNRGVVDPRAKGECSLLNDASLRRDLTTAMSDCGVSISLGDDLVIRSDMMLPALATRLDTLAELSVPRIATVTFDPDLSRSFDQFAILAEMARERDMETVLELVLVLPVVPCLSLSTRYAVSMHLTSGC